MNKDWGQLYSQGNSAAVFPKNCPAPDINGWPLDRVVRVTQGGDGYTIRDCQVSRTLDDAIEVNFGGNGTIRDCLIEDPFAGISCASASTRRPETRS